MTGRRRPPEPCARARRARAAESPPAPVAAAGLTCSTTAAQRLARPSPPRHACCDRREVALPTLPRRLDRAFANHLL
jgi:hypothetical protein